MHRRRKPTVHIFYIPFSISTQFFCISYKPPAAARSQGSHTGKAAGTQLRSYVQTRCILKIHRSLYISEAFIRNNPQACQSAGYGIRQIQRQEQRNKRDHNGYHRRSAHYRHKHSQHRNEERAYVSARHDERICLCKVMLYMLFQSPQ